MGKNSGWFAKEENILMNNSALRMSTEVTFYKYSSESN
jgi:hypothetical protein